jgi:hypothetical protein
MTDLVEIKKGDVWTGNSGMGPDVRINGVNLATSQVHATQIGDNTYPDYITSIHMFVSNYHPKRPGEWTP